MSISISHLYKQYAAQPVLHDVSLRIAPGEVAGFLGPNGAGKTTTMRILAGAVPYDAGSVQVCGLEVKDNRLQANALVGYLPEQNPLYTDMYVREYLLFVADTYHLGKMRRQRVDELIDLVGLAPERGKKIGQLSKGYRQRVGLAQALMPDPRVLILDEPTTGLDPNQLEDIRALIRHVGRDRTVLLSTHILQEVSALCNRVVIINHGRIVGDYDDLPAMLSGDGRHRRFEVQFLRPPLRDTLTRIGDVRIIKEYDPQHFLLSAGRDIRPDLFDLAVATRNKLLLLRPVDDTVEEVFRQLTKTA